MKLIKEVEVFPGVRAYTYALFEDNRGYFTETYNTNQLPFTVKQANESYSRAGVFRGLHIQTDPAMGKMVRVLKGKIRDYFLDLRPDSPTKGQIGSFELTAGDNTWLHVPQGFGHGILALKESTIEYFCDATYNPNGECSINYKSKGIDWSKATPLPDELIVSDRDKAAISYDEYWERQK